MSAFYVLTEHFPRNPSKPMYYECESRPIRQLVDADSWARSIREGYKQKKSPRLAETIVVEALSQNEIDIRLAKGCGNKVMLEQALAREAASRGGLATGEPDLADHIAKRLSDRLQRCGVVWPLHEIANLVRTEIIAQNS